MRKYKLGDIATVEISGVDKKIKDGEKEIRLCNFVDVYYNWAITTAQHDGFMLATASPNEISKFQLKKGQVALTKDSETRDDIGIPTYIADDFDDAILGYHCAMVTPNKDILDGRYLNALLHTDYAKKYFACNASGSGQRYALSVEALNSFPVPMIPLRDQERIGEIFSALDKKIELNRRINHDLYRGATIRSMEAIPDDIRESAKERYLKGDPQYRWSWKDFCFYLINKEEEYASRFKFFVEFYNRFYEGIRTIDDCDMLNKIIDFPEYNIAFATFNSCYRIDHLNQIGAINSKAIAESQSELSKVFKYGRFIVGVWHHNISGIPTQTNYLDPRVLHSLMDFHIQLGLYGHQHHTEALYEYHDIFKQGRMTLISSGCLYGRGKTMPEGTHCQYNILEIVQSEEKVNVILHVREDETAWDIPSWRRKLIEGKDSYSMAFNLPAIDYSRVLADCLNQAKVENNYKEAIENLISIRNNEATANKFIDEFLQKISNHDICTLEFEPMTIAQVIAVMGASIETHNWDTFDKAVMSADKHGLRNWQTNVLIEDANKIR